MASFMRGGMVDVIISYLEEFSAEDAI